MSSPAPDNLFSQLASAFREAEAWCFDHGATVSYSKPDGKPLVVVSVGECHGDGSSLIEATAACRAEMNAGADCAEATP